MPRLHINADGLVVLDPSRDAQLCASIVAEHRRLCAVEDAMDRIKRAKNPLSANGNVQAAFTDWNKRFEGGFRNGRFWWHSRDVTDLDDRDPVVFVTLLSEFAHLLKTAAVGNDVSSFVTTLLVWTPEFFLQRTRLSVVDAECPPGLRHRSYERPEVRHKIRYSPPLTLPPSLHEYPNTLVRPKPHFVIAEAITCAQACLWEVDEPLREGLKRESTTALIWLGGTSIEKWYLEEISPLEKDAFVTLLEHIAAEAARIGEADGCFIATSYLVSLPRELERAM